MSCARVFAFLVAEGKVVLLAYIDEISQPGAFVSTDDNRFHDGPAFGYGGFVIPEGNARKFGASFTREKRNLFPTETSNAEHEGRWERKGSDLLFARAPLDRPQNLRVLGYLINQLRTLGGNLFYYAEEKPIGTPKQTNCGPREFKLREETAMRETLNRIARFADSNDQNVLVMMDQINEKSRKQRLPVMYSHILGRAAEHGEMRRIVEPPMHIDSQLSSNIQFADWIAALVKRAIEYQLVENSRYAWVAEQRALTSARGAFTRESKLRLYKRDLRDLHHSQIMHTNRPLFDTLSPQTMSDLNRKRLEQVRKATFRDQS